MAERYKIAAEKVKLDWPAWKLAAMKEHHEKGINSRFTEEYVKAVAEYAENENLPLAL